MFLNPDFEEYIEKHTSPQPGVLKKLERETYLNVIHPRMLSGHLLGSFLTMTSHMLKPERILEIGTFTAYSAICLASGLKDDGKLHTIDVNVELEEMIDKYLIEAGVRDKVIFHLGDALEIIPALDEYFDLVFIDAAKENYLDYYYAVFDKVKNGGYILADNALWDGKVIEDESKMDKETKGITAFNDFIQQDERVENVLLPIRDGIMVIRKK